MLAVVGTHTGGKAALSSPSKRCFGMSSRTGNWMIAAGALILVMGLIALPAALGEHVETSLLTLGTCGVSVGSIVAGTGAYLKARALSSPTGAGASQGESKPSARRLRGGCDVCHGDLPVIHCKVHQVHLCPDCVAKHYDFRSCTYVPSTRGAIPKTAKALAKTQGA